MLALEKRRPHQRWWGKMASRSINRAQNRRRHIALCRKERLAAAKASPWAATGETVAAGVCPDRRSADGLTKKQRENKRKAAKKKAMKEAVEAARKAGYKR